MAERGPNYLNNPGNEKQEPTAKIALPSKDII